MGILATILAGLGAICAALGVIDILDLTDGAFISDKLNWTFWMYGAIILLLGAIACLLARKQNIQD